MPSEPASTNIGPYRLEGCVGEGAMAQVYDALDTRKSRRVAIKLMRASQSGRSEAVARFVREGRAMSRMSHPRIVEVYEHGLTDEGDAYIVMERLYGATLAALVREEGRLETRRALSLGIHIAEALAFVHDRGMIHRDLKPENVMVVKVDSPEEEAKLLDFGLARMSDADIGEDSILYTMAGQLIGSAAFMSPGQASGALAEPHDDVYALGTVLYEMLSGRLPYEVRSYQEALEVRRHADPIPLATRVAGLSLPSGLSALVMRMLARDPNQRPANGSAALHLLLDARARLEDAECDASTVVMANSHASSLEVAPLPAAPGAGWSRLKPLWLVAVTVLVAGAILIGVLTHGRYRLN
jgi:serine/threonine protein kinase